MSEYGPSFLRGLLALTTREVKKWLKEPIILMMAILQPIIWMTLFGKSMNLNALFSPDRLTVRLPDIKIPGTNIAIPGELITEQLKQVFSTIGSDIMRNVFGVDDYFSYMAVGMIAMIVMFTTMFSGMSIVWDRRLGFLEKVLTTPVSRAAIITSKMLNAALRAMFQATIVLAIAILLGLKLSPTFTLLNVIGVYAVIFLTSMGLSSLFLILALRSTRQETQMAVVNLINMPLMFASNTFYPVSMMPSWVKVIALINPMSYLNDALRQLVIMPLDISVFLLDITYLTLFAITLTGIGMVLSQRYLPR